MGFWVNIVYTVTRSQLILHAVADGRVLQLNGLCFTVVAIIASLCHCVTLQGEMGQGGIKLAHPDRSQ